MKNGKPFLSDRLKEEVFGLKICHNATNPQGSQSFFSFPLKPASSFTVLRDSSCLRAFVAKFVSFQYIGGSKVWRRNAPLFIYSLFPIPSLHFEFIDANLSTTLL